MLFEMMIKKLEDTFPSLEYSVDREHYFISIPAKNESVGGIEIQDEMDEMIVFIGNFTHWHIGCYEQSFSEKEKFENICNQVIAFLDDLFNDQVVMWGGKKAGGFYLKNEKPNSKSYLGFGKQNKEWVWSGEKY
ncbi:MAG: hypothetical protein ACKE8R_00520 [Methylophagaceae bacterium]